MPALQSLRYLWVPLRGASLILIVMFSVLLLIAAAGGLLGLPLAFTVISWFFKYGFALLDQIADGRDEPPVLSYEMVNPVNESRPLGLLVLVGIFWSVTETLLPSLGGEVTLALRLLALTLLPAIIMAQANGHFWQSLNPLVLVQIVTRVPGSYALIVAVLAGFWWLGTQLVAWMPQTELPFAIRIPVPDTLHIAIMMYAWLASFAMIGGVLFEHRLELGVEPTHSPERVAQKDQRERRREMDLLVDRIFAEWRGGAYGNAWRTIEAHLQKCPHPSGELKELFVRASTWPDQRLAQRLAQELLPQLLAARRTGDALEIARTQLRLDVNFRPRASGDTIKLIELARDAGDRRTARMLLTGFADRYDDAVDRRIAEQLARQLER